MANRVSLDLLDEARQKTVLDVKPVKDGGSIPGR